MLKNIKSSYFIKLIYTFIEEAQKLILVRYNKYIQKNLNISIINYNHFSGRYIIYESNEFRKEYYGYNDTLIFEGEHLNGKRNGKGKEYDKFGKVIFEGEYLNGKEWIGTGYDFFGNIIYKLNNNINGKGKEYYDGKLIFEGEYLNGKRHGKGKEYDKCGKLIFEGEYLNGKRYGKGKEYYEDGKLKFEGEYLIDKKWNGKGYDSLYNIIYELKDGKGIIKKKDYFADMSKFEEEYLNEKRNGIGKDYWSNGKLEFEGEYINGKKMEKEKNMIVMGYYYLKVSIYMTINQKVNYL